MKRSTNESLVTTSTDTTVRVWDVETGNLKQTFANGDRVRSVAFHPDGKIVAAAGMDNFGDNIWDIQLGTLRQSLTGHTDMVWSVSFSPDGRLLASGSVNNSARLWQGVE